jgi:hypothetical protein
MKPQLPPPLAIVATASAQIDAGGGKSAVGTMTNHASMGGAVASAPQALGSLTKRRGLIEVLYAVRGPCEPHPNVFRIYPFQLFKIELITAENYEGIVRLP